MMIVEKKPGLESYTGSDKNDVKSKKYGTWSGSVIFHKIPSSLLPTKDSETPKTPEPSAAVSPQPTTPIKPAESTQPYSNLSGQTSIPESPSNIPTQSSSTPPGQSSSLESASQKPTQPSTSGPEAPSKTSEPSATPSAPAAPSLPSGLHVHQDGSSICGAAIHAGAINNDGGSMLVARGPGQKRYEPFARNGIESLEHGESSGSFSITPLDAAAPTPTNLPTHATSESEKSDLPTANAACSSDATSLNAPLTIVNCPPGCATMKGQVWGTDIFTADSSICRAAIHAGHLTNEGGPTWVKKEPGQKRYNASIKNGVKTSEHEEWSESFSFISPSTNPSSSNIPKDTAQETVSNPATDTAQETISNPPKVYAHCAWSAKNLPALITRVRCPSECLNKDGDVWGSNPFTDSTAICRAGIHVGMFENDKGGEFIVVKKPGENSYQESNRNGVQSKSHGAWPGSFILVSLADFQLNGYMKYIGYNFNFNQGGGNSVFLMLVSEIISQQSVLN
ncbi:Hypothetical predicted protein [Pelobates cultripes]|uniref:LCCL domain-containing protein n=1 Tax=Pelobates cultripes TaxID=61616 RepID=A0AAD1WFT6_PELCU|nr:Hypothetical predicted protein [Pelobates cultripes]